MVVRSLMLGEGGRRGRGDDPEIKEVSSLVASLHAENTRLLT